MPHTAPFTRSPTLTALPEFVKRDIHNPSWRPLGDPAKVAQAILQVAAMDNPPTRLLLGSEAYAYATAAARAQLASDERWRELSRSTDRDDATPTERDPLGTHATAAI